MLCTGFSNPESQRRATACAKMCQQEKRMHAAEQQRVPRRRRENHCAQTVQCSLLSSPAALVAVLSFSLEFLWQRISPSWRNSYPGKPGLQWPSTNAWWICWSRSPPSAALCGIIMFSALPAWRALTRLFVFLPVEHRDRSL